MKTWIWIRTKNMQRGNWIIFIIWKRYEYDTSLIIRLGIVVPSHSTLATRCVIINFFLSLIYGNKSNTNILKVDILLFENSCLANDDKDAEWHKNSHKWCPMIN